MIISALINLFKKRLYLSILLCVCVYCSWLCICVTENQRLCVHIFSADGKLNTRDIVGNVLYYCMLKYDFFVFCF